MPVYHHCLYSSARGQTGGQCYGNRLPLSIPCFLRILLGKSCLRALIVYSRLIWFSQVPNQALYPSEILAYNSRGKGLAFYNLWRNIVLVINTYVPPVAIASVSWRFYLFYILFDAFGALVVYLLFVETRGWNLEEIEGIFNSPNPKKESLRKEKVVFMPEEIHEQA